MKKLYILAALLMATTSAHAGGMTFQINGERIRVEAPRNCNALSCIKITAPGYNGTLGNIDLKGLGSKSKDDDDRRRPRRRNRRPLLHPCRRQRPQPAAPVAAPAAPAPAPTTVASTAPVQPKSRRPRRLRRPPRRRARTAASRRRLPQRRARSDLAARHLGDRREQGQRSHRGMRRQSLRLCRQDGEKILISMKPQGCKWTGRIHDPDSGRNYNSTIALKGTNTLRVQGCAFGGMFCGGQTWKRVS